MSKANHRKAFRAGLFPCEVCAKLLPLVEHHISGREIKNANRKSNLAYLCASCHDCIHQGELILEGRFNTTNGPELIWRKKGEQPKLNEGMVPPLYSGRVKV